jgi:hypothetical protein
MRRPASIAQDSPDITPGGGVTVGTPGQRGGRYGGGGYRGTSQVVKVRPAPNVPQQYNWGILHVVKNCPSCGSFPSNVRDHRSVRR